MSYILSDRILDRQIKGFVKKQKKLIDLTPCEQEIPKLIMMWQGFITGLKLTGVIDWQQYKLLDLEIQRYVKKGRV